jgi:hypothetical protein
VLFTERIVLNKVRLIKWYFLLPLINACLPNFDEVSNFEHSSLVPEIIVESNIFLFQSSDDVVIRLKSSKEIFISQLRKHLFLLASPVREMLPINDKSTFVPVLLKKNLSARTFILKPKRKLISGLNYGLYAKNNEYSKLIFTFKIKNSAAKLIKHDIFDHQTKKISKNRIIFRFTFDQEIFLASDQAISLIDSQHFLPQNFLETLTIEEDQKTLTVRLKKNTPPVLLEGKSYVFVFSSGLQNIHHVSSNIEPIEFLVQNKKSELFEVNPVSIEASHTSIELKWTLNQKHWSQLFISKKQENFVCTNNCNAEKGSHLIRQKNIFQHQSALFLTGLKNQTSYQFVIRSEDQQGRIIFAQGGFSTSKPSPFHISEIMVSPKTMPGQREHSGEYIEIINTANEGEEINNLEITLEDISTGKSNSCRFLPLAPKRIAKNSYFLLVGKDFNKKIYGIDDTALIFRSNKKTLCGGLSNFKPKIIKLYGNNGHLIDHYGGFLWPSKRGRSIQRIDPMGLDVKRNYCYSDQVIGPTPGKPNGPCG